jgi:hypothetical protein
MAFNLSMRLNEERTIFGPVFGLITQLALLSLAILHAVHGFDLQ